MTKELFGNEPESPTDDVDFVAEAGKKFKKEDGALDVEGLAKGKYFADKTIEAREQELAALREDLKTRVTLEEFMAKIEAKKQAEASSEGEPPPQERNDQSKSQMSAEDLKKFVREELNQETQKSAQTRNVEFVAQELEKQWGPSYKTKLKHRSEELDVGQDFLASMAATKPKAFLELVGAKTATKSSDYVPPRSSARVDDSKHGEPRTFKEFEALRKKDPVTYWNAKVQNKMLSLLKERGEDFYK